MAEKKSERELIEAMRDDLRQIGKLFDRVMRNGAQVIALNAGDAVKMNAASKAVGHLRGAHSAKEIAHGAATDLLLENWEGYPDVITRGPPR